MLGTYFFHFGRNGYSSAAITTNIPTTTTTTAAAATTPVLPFFLTQGGIPNTLSVIPWARRYTHHRLGFGFQKEWGAEA